VEGEEKMVPHKIIDSFKSAVEGMIYVLKSQRNMRLHILAAAFILVLSVLLKMEVGDLLFLLSAVVLVLLAEMFNTAVELTIDMIKDSYHPLARIVKDVTAGAVFIASLYAVTVGYLVFFRKKYLISTLQFGLDRIRGSSWHVAFVCLAVVGILTLVIKILLKRGTPLRGGMPSVHAALAFSVFTLVSLLPGTPVLVVVLVFFLAFLVAQSRIASRIHSFYEVISGAVWGMVLTFLFFKLFTI